MRGCSLANEQRRALIDAAPMERLIDAHDDIMLDADEQDGYARADEHSNARYILQTHQKQK